jgi:Rrf2 family nitric oxide-sensitive transcriptional repressor
LEKARDAFVDVLEGYTLGDLVRPRGRLLGMLGISAIEAQR